MCCRCLCGGRSSFGTFFSFFFFPHPLTCRLHSLELGAGGGLVGLAVASGCEISKPLIMTDQQEMFSLMRHNIELNEQQSMVKPAILNW